MESFSSSRGDIFKSRLKMSRDPFQAIFQLLSMSQFVYITFGISRLINNDRVCQKHSKHLQE
jgi:hypothetical protein